MAPTIDPSNRISADRPALRSIAGAAQRRGQTPLAPLTRGEHGASSITAGTLRSVIAASDALRLRPAACADNPAETVRAAHALAELLRRFQATSRQCVREWLHDPQPTVWLVEAASGRIVGTMSEPTVTGSAVDAGVQGTLADEQPLHGLRERHAKAGVGVPVILAQRAPPQVGAMRPSPSDVLSRTAVVGIERGFDTRIRSIRIRLHDPDERVQVRLHGREHPLAADHTAAVAHMLGRERRLFAGAPSISDSLVHPAREGFTPLTPMRPGQTPLVLIEGAGLSPLMMAQVANAVVGDAALRARYQVWLYRYPMTAPLFLSAGRLRADLGRFYAALAAQSDRPAQSNAVFVAQGPGALLARSLLLDATSAIWNAVFTGPAATLQLPALERRVLERLLCWRPCGHVARVIAVGTPGNLAALTAGVGERAVQSLLQQPLRLRAALASIHERACGMLQAPSPGTGAPRHAEPLHQAVHAGAVAADRALLARLAEADPPSGASLYQPGSATVPAARLTRVADGSPLGPQAMRQLLDWLGQFETVTSL